MFIIGLTTKIVQMLTFSLPICDVLIDQEKEFKNKAQLCAHHEMNMD